MVSESSAASGVTEPIGRRIGITVRRIRHEQGLDLRRLAERLAEEGRPISLAQLSKLELGQRRVDVDDLVALAVVLNVTPTQLLMPQPPAEGDDQVVSLTPYRQVGWHRAWQWMCGDFWLDDSHRPGADEEDVQGEAQTQADWHWAARPHDPFGGYMFSPSFIYGREQDVHAVVFAVQEALKTKEGMNTIDRRTLFAAVDWFLTVSTGIPEKRQEPARG